MTEKQRSTEATERPTTLGRRSQLSAQDAALNSLLANFGLVSVDFAVGESGHERVVLKVSKPGTYVFPEVVSAGEAISVRPSLDNPPGVEVRLKIRWDEAT